MDKETKKFYKELREKNVLIFNPATVYISPEAEIEEKVTIHSGAQIIGKTRIGTLSVIGANSVIRNSEIGNVVLIKENCVIENSIIESRCKIGPLAHLRPGTILKDNVRIGSTEIKNSIVDKNTKIPHFGYIGDAEIGKNVNIGAGTVTCNYDGEKKHKTIIEDGVFVGSNVTIIPPITIGKNAYIAGGSTITRNILPYTLVIGRAWQTDKLDWVKKHRKNQSPKKD